MPMRTATENVSPPSASGKILPLSEQISKVIGMAAMDRHADQSSEAGAGAAAGEPVRLWDEAYAGFKVGAKDELAYEQTHTTDSGVRAGLAVGISYITSKAYMTGGRASSLALLTSVGLSAGHYFMPEHKREIDQHLTGTKSLSESMGYLAGRYATDLGLTFALANSAARGGWHIKGSREITNIIDTESSAWAQLETKGSRVRFVDDTTRSLPIFRQERGEDLAELLIIRRQPQLMEKLLPRLKAKAEPENVETWSDGVKTPLGTPVPTFDPVALRAYLLTLGAF